MSLHPRNSLDKRNLWLINNTCFYCRTARSPAAPPTRWWPSPRTTTRSPPTCGRTRPRLPFRRARGPAGLRHQPPHHPRACPEGRQPRPPGASSAVKRPGPTRRDAAPRVAGALAIPREQTLVWLWHRRSVSTSLAFIIDLVHLVIECRLRHLQINPLAQLNLYKF